MNPHHFASQIEKSPLPVSLGSDDVATMAQEHRRLLQPHVCQLFQNDTYSELEGQSSEMVRTVVVHRNCPA